MSIAKTDIKLMSSERLTDYDDGGGQMIGVEITDGTINNLFPDISRLDRVYGRVSLRKAFPGVMTANRDMYYGGHVILSAPPDDDNVHVTLFSTGDHWDERADARDRVESYVTMAQELLLRPMNAQLQGQRAITCFTQPDQALPEIGDTIVLNDVATGNQQFLRITGLAVERATYAIPNYGQFSVDVVTLDLSAALQHNFPGIEPTPYTTKAQTRIHATLVADASNYYGVRKLAQPATAGDMTFWVDSIYNQLVPTSQQETALIDQMMSSASTLIAMGAAISLTGLTRTDAAPVVHFPTGILPGSLALTVAGYALRDVRGVLTADGDNGGYGGFVDYTSGQITLEKSGAWSASVAVTATPACAVAQSPVSAEIPVELASRAYNYTPSLTGPLPSPGSIRISYIAQGKWYELYDDGQGVFVGHESGTGTGTVNYATGSCIITLGALPDVGTSIIIQWGHALEITDHAGDLDDPAAQIHHTLPDARIEPGSLAISWTVGETPKSAADDSHGALTGDATGTIDYASGELLFCPTSIPDSGTGYSIGYDCATGESTAPETEILSVFMVDGNTITCEITDTPLTPGTVEIRYNVKRISCWRAGRSEPDYATTRTVRTVYDDGNGHLRDRRNGTVLGTIDYTTGVCSWAALKTYTYTHYRRHFPRSVCGYVMSGTSVTDAVEGAPVDLTVTYTAASLTYAAVPLLAAAPLTVDLCPDTTDTILPRGCRFTLGGYEFYDDGSGNLYRDRDQSTGVGTLAGSLNYTTGEAVITTYPALESAAVTRLGLLTRDGGYTAESFVFRTPGAPVRDASLSLRGTLADNTLRTAQADVAGAITATGVAGTIDTATGVVRVRFGQTVAAAGYEEEPWYRAEDVDGDGNIWMPEEVVPETALYNCVFYSYLPLDAALLGIEPVRLPQDGRVPIFKSGMVAVIHNTASDTLPEGLTAGQEITLTRDALALCELHDQTGAVIPEALYTVTLAAGTVTMADPLDLSGYTQPLVAVHRIEDMVLISEAQINGMLRAVGHLTHDYPANTTQVSSALILGDLAARIVRQYTQKTWTGVWADSRTGDDISAAAFDDLHYPILVTNQGALAQRWCILFTGATAFNVVSEDMGVIATGTTASDCQPINPATEVPYFTIDYRGWGSGWASGNCLRFDTSAANAPIWIARTTMPGPVEEPTDEFVLQIRGDAN